MVELFSPTNCFFRRSIISADQFDTKSIEQVCKAARFVDTGPQIFGEALKGKILITYFYQESTRTRLSFEACMHRLGGDVISTTDAARTSSALKGETLEHTMAVISGYGDVIVLRHTEEGSAAIAAEKSIVPVINGGDGPGEHPTQALVDLYTLWSTLGRLDNLRIAVVGDLLYGRTVHSLVKALALYPGNSVVCVTDPELALPKDLATSVQAKGLKIAETQDLGEAVRSVDVVYMTRIQLNLFKDKVKKELEVKAATEEELERLVEERVADFKARTEGKYILYRRLLPDIDELAEDEGLVWVMHPMPILWEIPREVDSYRGSIYIRQARENAMAVKRALLLMVLGA
jgi:aspartate carbamoyltransferase catalytic subunit